MVDPRPAAAAAMNGHHSRAGSPAESSSSTSSSGSSSDSGNSTTSESDDDEPVRPPTGESNVQETETEKGRDKNNNTTAPSSPGSSSRRTSVEGGSRQTTSTTDAVREKRADQVDERSHPPSEGKDGTGVGGVSSGKDGLARSSSPSNMDTVYARDDDNDADEKAMLANVLSKFTGTWKCTTAGGYVAIVSKGLTENSLVARSEGDKPFWDGPATGRAVAKDQLEMNWKDLKLLGKLAGDGRTIIWSNSERWYAVASRPTSTASKPNVAKTSKTTTGGAGGGISSGGAKDASRSTGSGGVKRTATKTLAEGNVLTGMWSESKGQYMLEMRHDVGLHCEATLLGTGPWLGEAKGTLKDLSGGGQVRMDFSGVVLIGSINKTRTKITWSNQVVWNRIDEKKASSSVITIDGAWKANTLGYRATIQQKEEKIICTQHPPKTVWVIEAHGTLEGCILKVAFPDLLTGVVKNNGKQIDWSNGAVWIKVNNEEKRQRRPSSKVVEMPGNSDGLRWCTEVVYKKVVAFEHSWPFMRAVDPEKDQAPDYYDVIKSPMHLGEINRKLIKSLYSSVDECLRDFQKVFDNCKLYNRDATNPIRIWCAELEAIFHKVKAEQPKPGKFPRQASPGPGPSPLASVASKNSSSVVKRKREISDSNEDGDKKKRKSLSARSKTPAKTPAKRPTAAEKRANQERRRLDDKRERQNRRLRLMQIKHCKKVLHQLLGKKYHNENQWFREPVDVVRFGLHDYLEKVQRPMDLGTIRKNLDNGLYRSGDDFARDVRQVWHNCRIYNPPGDPVASSGFTMSKVFEQLWRELPTEEDAVSESEPEPEPPVSAEKKVVVPESESSDSSSSSDTESESDNEAMVNQLKMLLSKMKKKKKKKSSKGESKDVLEKLAKLAGLNASKKRKKAAKKDSAKKPAPTRKRPPAKAKRPPPSSKPSTPVAAEANSRKRPPSTAKRTQSATGARRPPRPSANQIAAAQAAAAKAEEDAKLASISTPMSYEDKVKLTEDINKLNDEQMSRVEKIIQDNVDIQGHGQEVEVDVDSMDTRTLRKLERYIQSCMNKAKPAPSVKGLAASRPLSSAGSTGSVEARAKSVEDDDGDNSSSGSSSSSSSSGSSSEDEADEPVRAPEKVNFSVDAMNVPKAKGAAGAAPAAGGGGPSRDVSGASSAAVSTTSAATEKLQLQNMTSWSTLKDGSVSSAPSTPAAVNNDSDDFNRMKSQALEAQEKEKRLKEIEAKSAEETVERHRREAMELKQQATKASMREAARASEMEAQKQGQQDEAQRRRDDARREREKRMQEQQNTATSEDLMAVFQ